MHQVYPIPTAMCERITNNNLSLFLTLSLWGSELCALIAILIALNQRAAIQNRSGAQALGMLVHRKMRESDVFHSNLQREAATVRSTTRDAATHCIGDYTCTCQTGSCPCDPTQNSCGVHPQPARVAVGFS